jgi:MoaE-MoaD fusion protein
MLVRIRLFAQLRERAGASELSIELPEGARVRDALADAAVAALADGLPLVLAVNRSYAPPDAPLAAGDELALIPPVSGGTAPHAALVDGPLSLDALVARVRDPRAGAVVTFCGVTRELPALDYEAYAEMALDQMRAVVTEAIARHGLCAAAAEHRLGRVPLSEASVIVAVSAPHRAEAFAGGREIIDRVKALAPIWKREHDAAGAVAWVPGTPPPTGA